MSTFDESLYTSVRISKVKKQEMLLWRVFRLPPDKLTLASRETGTRQQPTISPCAGLNLIFRLSQVVFLHNSLFNMPLETGQVLRDHEARPILEGSSYHREENPEGARNFSKFSKANLPNP